jgi:hypothetical protein
MLVFSLSADTNRYPPIQIRRVAAIHRRRPMNFGPWLALYR